MSSLGAFVVVDKENIDEYLEKHKISTDGVELNNIKELKSLIKSEISHLVNEKTGFRPYEYVSKVRILSSEFSIENKMLTQSLKMKRNEILAFYEKEIEDMYV